MLIDSLNTEKLLLRPLEQNDARYFLKHINKVNVYLEDDINTLEEADKRVLAMLTSIQDQDAICFSVIAKQTGEFVGACGIQTLKNDPSLYWWIKLESQKQGFGFEATEKLIEWALENVSPKLNAHVHEFNYESIQLCKKLGGKSQPLGALQRAAGIKAYVFEKTKDHT